MFCRQARRIASVDDPRAVFASNLRQLRAQRGMSQETLGYKAGLHRTEISLLERSARDPRLGTIVRVARALDTTPGRLLKGIA